MSTMVRNPIHVIPDTTTPGLVDVPLYAAIQILDADGQHTPAFIQLIDKTGFTASTSFVDIQDDTTKYRNLGGGGFVSGGSDLSGGTY